MTLEINMGGVSDLAILISVSLFSWQPAVGPIRPKIGGCDGLLQPI